MSRTRDRDAQPVSTSEARDQLAELLNQVAYRGARFVLERRGKQLAALVPIEDLQLLQTLAAGARDAPSTARNLVSTDLVSTDLVSTDLVSTDLVSTDLVSTDLVSTDVPGRSGGLDP
jgi:prevent-host-death family protein